MDSCQESISGAPGTPPGSGGIGGYGGKGGKLRIKEGAEVWKGAGDLGERGSYGVSGQPSRNGRASPSFSAVERQWYFERGWYHGTTSKPEVRLEPPTPIATPQLMYADSATGRATSPVDNSSLGLPFCEGEL